MTIREQAEHLYRDVDVFMLSCVDLDGYPLTKAVVPGKYRERLNKMYFSTNTSSKFVDAIIQNEKSNVYFFRQDETAWAGCFLKGDIEIVTDMGVKEKYWLEDYKDAYAQGVFTDPDYCLLEFTPNAGRLYTGESIEDLII